MSHRFKLFTVPVRGLRRVDHSLKDVIALSLRKSSSSSHQYVKKCMLFSWLFMAFTALKQKLCSECDTNQTEFCEDEFLPIFK